MLWICEFPCDRQSLIDNVRRWGNPVEAFTDGTYMVWDTPKSSYHRGCQSSCSKFQHLILYIAKNMEDMNWDLDWVCPMDSMPFGVGRSGWDNTTEWSWRVEVGQSSRPWSHESVRVQTQQEHGCMDGLVQRQNGPLKSEIPALWDSTAIQEIDIRICGFLHTGNPREHTKQSHMFQLSVEMDPKISHSVSVRDKHM